MLTKSYKSRELRWARTKVMVLKYVQVVIIKTVVIYSEVLKDLGSITIQTKKTNFVISIK